MSRKLLIFMAGFFLVVSSSSAYSAITYEFRQISRSDFQNSSDGEVAGTGVIDGARSRVNLVKASGQTPGTYIISYNDSQMLFIVDPAHKRFTEVNAAKIASAFGSNRIQIANLKSNHQRLPDRPIIAGLPTEHYRIIASYEITVMFGTLPLRQSVVTTIDKWVTTAFSELAEPGLNTRALRTGNPAVDQLIEAELVKVKGFPLKQITTIQTTAQDIERNPRSELKLTPTRTQTRELVITRIAATTADPVLFEVPKAYAKIEPDAEEERPAVHMLSMEP